MLNTLAYTGIPITKNGYLYIYVNNETPGWDVYFDNMSVKHYSGAITEETHYYPFGLTMSSISTKAAAFGNPENKYKFNKGSEFQNKEFSDGSGLEWYATNFRMYDPQICRWHVMDPKPDYSQSLYSGMGNNPILVNDPLGDTVRKQGFTNTELLNWIRQGLNTNDKKNPFSFNKNGDLTWSRKKYDKLSDARKEIANNIIGAILSDKTFNIIKVNADTKIANLTGQNQYVKGDDGKIKDATMADMGGGFTMKMNEKGTIINNYIVGTSTDGIEKGITGVGECKGLNISNPNFLVFFHEVGGHDFYRYVTNPSDPQQGACTLEYENLVRALNKMDLRANDYPYHPPRKQ